METSRYLTRSNLNIVAKNETFLARWNMKFEEKLYYQYFYFKKPTNTNQYIYCIQRIDRMRDDNGVELVGNKYSVENDPIYYTDDKNLIEYLYTPGYNGLREALIEACKRVSIGEKLDLI